MLSWTQHYFLLLSVLITSDFTACCQKKPKPNHIRVYSDHVLWHNENLWNLGISNTSKSPSDAEPRWHYSWLFHVYCTNPLSPRKEIPRCASISFPNKELFWQMFYVLTCFPKKSYTVLKAFWLGWLQALGEISVNPCTSAWERLLISDTGNPKAKTTVC